MALPAALLVPTVVAYIIFIAYLIQTVLGLQALQVALQRSKAAKKVFRLIPWDAATPLLQSALRGYGLRTAATPWVAFLAAAGWALLLLPGLAFLRWEPAAFWAPAPWLRPGSALGRAEALRRAPTRHLILIRHGQYELDYEGEDGDPPLTALGELQSRLP